MTTFAENIDKFNELQRQGLEPVRDLTVFAVDAFEKIARKNYALAGDVLEFAVSQAKLPVDANGPKDLFESQVASNTAFAELLKQRAEEYVELTKELQDSSVSHFEKDVVEPAKEAAKAASRKAA